jgi:hypothetical protein
MNPKQAKSSSSEVWMLLETLNFLKLLHSWHFLKACSQGGEEASSCRSWPAHDAGLSSENDEATDATC